MSEVLIFIAESDLITVIFVVGAIMFLLSVIKISGTIEISNPMRIVLGVFGLGFMCLGFVSIVAKYSSSVNPEEDAVQNTQINETPTLTPFSTHIASTATSVAITPVNTPTEPPSTQAILSTPTTSPIIEIENSILANANKSCQEFGGTPIRLDNITSVQIEKWRLIGKTDRNEVGRVIYCEIHQVLEFVPFVENDTIPENVIITADLGFNWNTQYPNSLERLVHDGGGWGVFLTLKPVVIQHANDLSHDIGGQYWYVTR